MTRRQDIQGLRAIAVVMVVAFHAGLPLPGGFSGVDVFFVISGFVIGRMLLRELGTTGRIDLRRFVVGRVRRLVPALALVLAVTVLLAGTVIVGDRLTDTVWSAGAAVVMVANAFFYISTGGYFDVQDAEVPLLHTWTLSVEGQFYLLAPLALVAIWSLAGRRWPDRRRAVLFIATALLAVASFAAAQLLASGRAIGSVPPSPESFAFYLSPTRAWEFLVGTLIAIAETRLLASSRRTSGTAVAFVGLVGVFAAAAFAGKTGPVPGTGVLLPVLGAALLIIGTTAAPDGPLSRMLAWRPFTTIGDLSYSWYLWHWPLIVLGGTAFAGRDVALPLAAASLVPAWWSYRFVEERFRRDRDFSGRRAIGLALGSIAGLAAIGAGVGQAQDALLRGAGLGGLRQTIQRPALLEGGGCRAGDGDVWRPAKSSGAAHCLSGAGSARRVLLVGDSQADAYAYGLRAALRPTGLRLDAITGPSCTAALVRDEQGTVLPGATNECVRMEAQIRRTIAADPPALLVVAQSRSSGQLQSPGSGAGFLAENERKMRLYVKALEDLTAAVSAAGGHVLFLRTVPNFQVDGSTCGAPLHLLRGDERRCLEAARDDAERSAGTLAVWRATETFAERRSWVSLFDPANLFCNRQTCSQIRDGRLAYRNIDHLGVEGSLGLTEPLRTAVQRALPVVG